MESVLRYGLPVNFQAMVLLPQKKTQKKLRDVLNQQYIHLDSPGGGSSADVSFCILYQAWIQPLDTCNFPEPQGGRDGSIVFTLFIHVLKDCTLL